MNPCIPVLFPVAVEPSWEGLVQPLEKLTDKHSRIWGIVTHLKVGGGGQTAHGGGGGGRGGGGGGGGGVRLWGGFAVGDPTWNRFHRAPACQAGWTAHRVVPLGPLRARLAG